MTGVRVSPDYGIIIRKAALQKQKVSLQMLLEVMEIERPLDENNDLISFGPHFGVEARNEFIRRLETLGLIYGDEFFDFQDTIPDWCKIYAALQ